MIHVQQNIRFLKMVISLAVCTKEEQHPVILLLWSEVVPTAENSVKTFLHKMGTVLYGIEMCMSGWESSKAVVQM
jgi:hypothetical protein